MLESVRAFIFDLDDTLLASESAVEASLMDICREVEKQYGLETGVFYKNVRTHARSLWYNSPHRQFINSLDISSIEGLCLTFEGNYPCFAAIQDWAREYRFTSWQNALKECGIGDENLASRLTEEFITCRMRYVKPYDDTVPCLRLLSKQYSLALITNGTPNLQYDKIDSAGIRGYFSHIIVAGELGYGKPDRRIFEYMLSRLKVEVNEVWMVGNNLAKDIAGAQALGMKAVWVNRNGVPGDGVIVPDMEIASLNELSKITG
jgi:putative hydrolase of the HAD superfamily